MTRPALDRHQRLDLIVSMIRDRPGISSPTLARELKVSVRTVFRDIGYLRTRGVPIESDVGPGGGLRLPPRFGLGRVQLTPEQGLCVLLALAVSEKLDFPMFAREFRPARRTLVGAYPTEERRVVARLQERVFVGSPASEDVRRSYRRPDQALMEALQSAFVRERALRIRYKDGEGTITTRVVEPHALSIRWPAWYLLAVDGLRQAVRTFRLDRLRAVEILESQSFRADPSRILEWMEALPGLPLR